MKRTSGSSGCMRGVCAACAANEESDGTEVGNSGAGTVGIVIDLFTRRTGFESKPVQKSKCRHCGLALEVCIAALRSGQFTQFVTASVAPPKWVVLDASFELRYVLHTQALRPHAAGLTLLQHGGPRA